jgi:hypothetical protein
MKLGDVPVPLKSWYEVQYTIQAGACDNYGAYGKCTCATKEMHSSSDEGKTYTYEVTGVTLESKCKLK